MQWQGNIDTFTRCHPVIFLSAPEIQGYQSKRAIQCGLLYLYYLYWILLRTETVIVQGAEPFHPILPRLKLPARNATLADLHNQSNIDKPETQVVEKKNGERLFANISNRPVPTNWSETCYTRYPASPSQPQGGPSGSLWVWPSGTFFLPHVRSHAYERFSRSRLRSIDAAGPLHERTKVFSVLQRRSSTRIKRSYQRQMMVRRSLDNPIGGLHSPLWDLPQFAASAAEPLIVPVPNAPVPWTSCCSAYRQSFELLRWSRPHGRHWRKVCPRSIPAKSCLWPKNQKQAEVDCPEVLRCSPKAPELDNSACSRRDTHELEFWHTDQNQWYGLCECARKTWCCLASHHSVPRICHACSSSH